MRPTIQCLFFFVNIKIYEDHVHVVYVLNIDKHPLSSPFFNFLVTPNQSGHYGSEFENMIVSYGIKHVFVTFQLVLKCHLAKSGH